MYYINYRLSKKNTLLGYLKLHGRPDRIYLEVKVKCQEVKCFYGFMALITMPLMALVIYACL